MSILQGITSSITAMVLVPPLIVTMTNSIVVSVMNAPNVPVPTNRPTVTYANTVRMLYHSHL